jgi:hypothetical protein
MNPTSQSAKYSDQIIVAGLFAVLAGITVAVRTGRDERNKSDNTNPPKK